LIFLVAAAVAAAAADVAVARTAATATSAASETLAVLGDPSRTLSFRRSCHRSNVGSLFSIQVLDEDELLFDRSSVGDGGLLFGILEETVDATMERVNFIRVDVGATDPVNAIESELDVILSDFGGVGTLSHPLVAIDFVVSNGHSIVEEDRAGWWRRSRRRSLPLDDRTA